jgi:hypothetical protein
MTLRPFAILSIGLLLACKVAWPSLGLHANRGLTQSNVAGLSIPLAACRLLESVLSVALVPASSLHSQWHRLTFTARPA